MERENSSVLQQLSNAHKEQVKFNRKYLQVIIECLIFTAMQNIVVRGHEESRNDIWEVSDRITPFTMQRLAMATVKTPGAAPVACSVDNTHHPK